MRGADIKNKPRPNKSGDGVHANFTLNQLKLCAASEFRAEGFDVTFDRVIELSGRRIRFHVYCEDVLGTRVAAICVNEVNDARIREVFDVIDSVRFSGEDIEVVVCFPISLLNRARVLIGITPRVFMVDCDGRVWVHYPWQGVRRAKITIPLEQISQEGDEEGCEGGATNITNNSACGARTYPFYV